MFFQENWPETTYANIFLTKKEKEKNTTSDVSFTWSKEATASVDVQTLVIFILFSNFFIF